MRDWRNNQSTVALETDESPVEEVVDAGRQQQSILAVQPFCVVAVTPWLAVASSQVKRIIYAGDPASALDLHDALFEEPLPTPRHDEGFAFGRRNGGVPVQL